VEWAGEPGRWYVRAMRKPADHPSIAEIVKRQREFFLTDATRPIAWRRSMLASLEDGVREYEDRLFAALKEDLGKSAEESFGTELGLVLGELKLIRKNLSGWMKSKRVKNALVLFPGKSSWRYEPLGVSLLISPWNYPVQLSLVPLVGALATGCTAVLKPSEQSPATSAVLEDLVHNHFDPEVVSVVQGGADVSEQLLAQHWDKIFFTGSTAVGRKVAEVAGRTLTPVTLELGGKSPCIIAADADLAVAARRVAWGKAVNAGQSCVAPDYVLVEKDAKPALVRHLREAWTAMLGAEPIQSPDYGRIVNDRHYRRLTSLLKHGRVTVGGATDAATRFIEPTVLEDVDPQSPLMQEEIFGPLLPVIAVDSVEHAVRFVRERPRPLALYLFSRSSTTQELVHRTTSSGSYVVNDTLMQVGSAELHFGGVGQSGMGRYHGQDSFESFSHRKAVFERPAGLDLPVRYPPLAGRLPLLRKLVG